MKNMVIVALVGWTCLAGADLLVGSPEMTPTSIGADGTVHEDWGVVSLKLDPMPADASTEQRYENTCTPAVLSKTSAGPLTLSQCVYRSPIWPVGVDVLLLAVDATQEMSGTLRVAVPETVSVGERLGVAGGRPVLYVLSGPKLERKMKAWGCMGGAMSLPGWATPNVECDPAFKNIRAGMGGVPIEYRFAVPAGEKRTVALGFCESFQPSAGIRPLRIEVEGTPEQDLDPIAAWGRHVPGCLRFDAADADKDGYIKVVVGPHPAASDRNPILNAAWVFKPDVPVDLDQVKLGKSNDAAEYFADAGGAKDQCIYENGPVAYDLKLTPDRPVEMAFLLAAPGGVVPTPPTAWTADKLYRTAVEAWGDWFCQGRKDLLDPPAAAEREALFKIALTRIQANGFFLALPVERYAAAQAGEAIALLDKAELFDEAGRLLRVYWNKEVPPLLVPFAQQPDGSWRDAANDPGASAHVLLALANHALATKDLHWIDKAWLAMKAGADALSKSPGDPGNAAIQAVAQVQVLDPARFK
ncbi:MAG: hypothetical protein NTU83_12260 [Candidatus Hydrogenedentes bacterium]|nr:hypothetical protein [Candidatus Hydrogenedentota bacterium]